MELLESVEAKISKSNLSNLESLPESTEDLINSLSSDLHPNHFLIFGLKKESIAKNQISRETKTSTLKLMLRYIVQVLSIVELLDPGVTLHRATLFKVTSSLKLFLFLFLKLDKNPVLVYEKVVKYRNDFVFSWII